MPAINVAKRKRAVRIANARNSIECMPVSNKAKEQDQSIWLLHPSLRINYLTLV